MTASKIPSYLMLFVLMSSLTGCLKTRAQLRDDEDSSASVNSSRPTPVNQVQDVHPQGQYVVDELKGEIIRLNGRIEDLERAQKQGADQNNQALKQDLQKLETRMNELEVAQRETLERLKAAETEAANPEEIFSKGKQQFASGDFEGAIESLSTYLKNPKAPKGEEATYLRGESYFNLKQYKKAIVDYSKFPERYGKSPRMATVLYKTGMSFDALGLKDDAKSFYQELVEKHPKSAEAKRARAKLR